MKVVFADSKEVMGGDYSYLKQYFYDNTDNKSEIVFYEHDGDDSKFIDELKDADGLITGYLEIDEKIMKECKKLKTISIMATGYNFINIEHANKYNIAVSVIAEYCTQEVADHVMALMLSLNKKIKHYTNEIDNKYNFDYSSTSAGMKLEGSTLGIFGLGKIGRAVAKRAQGFGVNVIGYDPYIKPELAKECGIEMKTVDEIFETSDNISLNMLLTEENTYFLNKLTFNKMKKNPYILNVSRGMLINEDDLAEALDSGIIKGAGLDVLSTESPDLENSPLVGRENVVITPHSAFFSADAMLECQKVSCDNVLNYLNNDLDKMFRLVNHPNDFHEKV